MVVLGERRYWQVKSFAVILYVINLLLVVEDTFYSS